LKRSSRGEAAIREVAVFRNWGVHRGEAAIREVAVFRN
jgi:hypothetical protein